MTNKANVMSFLRLKMKEKFQNQETVVKSNSLIQAGYRLTLAEQRIILAAIAQVRRDREISSGETYSITANALSDMTGTSAQRAYKELSDAAQRLYKREVRIEGGPNGKNNGPSDRVTMTRWVQAVEYVKYEGRIEIEFASRITPYLSLLHREFTSYKLAHVAKMRSTHGIRLYEVLQQWRQSGERELDLEDLRRMFGVEGKYQSIKDLKARVIEPAIKDVNEQSDLIVDWGQRKKGRQVVAIQFVFEPKDGYSASSRLTKNGSKKQKDATADYIKNNAKPGETWEAARARLGISS